jgi:pyruvate/2-oxoglutarate/acetoin dehydrogenase E1 component
MAITLRDTIKSIVKEHLQNKKGKAYGQCLTAVGWVGGTLPELYEDDGMIELSMADVAGGAIVVGAALANTRPIYVVRYQGFQWYNCVSIVNYAAKSKEMWQKPCPIFVRSIAMEGGIGPVAGSSHHSLYYRMPGIKIASPVSPNEYKQVYESFMNDDIP